MLHNLSTTKSLIGNFLSEIRSVEIQKDPLRFRKNFERIAEIMAYEVSKTLTFKTISVTTPLAIANLDVITEQPVLATILRAGLSMHQGMLNYFDKADSAFISAYRRHSSEEEFDIHVEYLAAPTIDNKVVIISDPMLATGSSMVTVYKALLKQGNPSKIIVVSAIATQEAIEFVQKHLPLNTDIWVAAIDSELTAQSYIVPGLGDAGDLAYGIKC
jgi:uracil phosphoribosyltransferase